MGNDETHYQVMRVLEGQPKATQRALAQELGVSLGKVHYCLKALIKKGWLKAVPYKNGQDRAAYQYSLTRLGKEEKARLTVRFMASKMREYEGLLAEIEKMQLDARRRTSRGTRQR
jgi:EPS-associated MarR family transcriptional regulator